MGTKILALIVLVAVCCGGYVYYTRQKEQTQLLNGDVQCIGCDTPEQHARFLRENSGETADGNSERKNTSARQAAAQATAADANAPAASSPAREAGTTPQPIPNAQNQQAQLQPTPTPTAPPAEAYNQAALPISAQPPTADSQTANNPNGMRFAGTGTYQWYRQGNLTYRIDTASGRSCIAYATMQEWRKQIVMSHGCNRES